MPRKDPDERKQWQQSYVQQYLEKNREAINLKKCEKVSCECGAITRKANLADHRRTVKHLKIISEKNNLEQ